MCYIAQVIEFVQFKERLQHSMQYLSVRSDSIILSLKQKAESLDEVEVSHGLSDSKHSLGVCFIFIFFGKVTDAFFLCLKEIYLISMSL